MVGHAGSDCSPAWKIRRYLCASAMQGIHEKYGCHMSGQSKMQCPDDKR
jgi:hypothetical protein